MLKYTLGALAAFVILAVTGFFVIAQVTGGNANSGPAPQVIFGLFDDHMSPPAVLIKRGQIVSLRFDNQSADERGIILESEYVEQFPELSSNHDSGPAPTIAPNVTARISPRQSDDVLVRFKKSGSYTISSYIMGTFDQVPYSATIIVE